jgi:hypothetical protein
LWHGSEFESEFEPIHFLSVDSPPKPQFNSTRDTPPIFYLSFGPMPGQHVIVGAQTVTLDVVRVGGRYRVGKLLGAETFGTSI